MKTHAEKVFHQIELVAVVLLFSAALASQAGGKVAAWGDNTYGQRLLPNGLDNVKAIAGGWRHSLALKTDGTVVAWGYTNGGAINVPAGLSNVIEVAAGNTMSLALKTDGKVVSWGWPGTDSHTSSLSNVVAIAAGWNHWLALKSDGMLATHVKGDGNNNPVPAISNVVAVAAGYEYSLALKSNGKVVAWGWNAYGQTNVPVHLSNVVAIAAGASHALALRADGTVAAWGGNWAKQAAVPTGLSNVVAIAAGTNHSLALKADGRVVAWGSTAGAEFGSSPSVVPPGLASVKAIAAGASHSLALVFDGPPEIVTQPRNTSVAYRSNVVLSVVARGTEPLAYRWYFNGQALSTSDRITSTTLKALSISNAQFSDSGTYSVIVSNAFGLVQSTGAVLTVVSPPILVRQPASQIVLAGTNVNLSAEVIGTPPLSYQWRFKGVALTGATKTSLSLSNVQSSQSGAYSLLVTNAYGKAESSNAVVTVLESAPYILTQPTNRTALLGCTASFSVNARGSAPLGYQWRFNGVGIPGATSATLGLASLRFDQAGYYAVAISNAFGETISAKAELKIQQVAVWGASSSLLPTNVPPGLTNLVSISANNNYILGLKADGTVALWGRSASQGGIPIPTNVPPELRSVTAIAAGYQHCLALRSNGTIVAWGFTSALQFPTNNSPTIVVPAGLSNVVAVAAGEYHSLALKENGQVVSWGSYLAYSIDGTPKPPLAMAATNVPAGLSNVVAIAAGGAQSLALKSDGTVRAWGYSTNVPTGLSNVIAIACADGLNLALKADGKITAWAGNRPGSDFPYRPSMTLATNAPTTLSNVVAIAAGGLGRYALALKADGSLVAWGSSVPQPPTGLGNVFAITAGGDCFAALLGTGSPHFAVQPVSQVATKGTTVRLHARAVGVQPLRYQWQRYGTAIVGATESTLVITNVEGSNAGTYRAVVTNGFGTATSAPAVLTIPFDASLAAALNTTNLTWSTSGSASWFAQNRVTHDGNTAAQSGPITHSQQSILQTTLPGPGTLTFWWKVSSEEGYDRLWFNVDVMSSIRKISGEKDWQQVTMPIPTGSHVVRWVYSKDATVSVGQDAGWVDQVVFTPTPRMMLAAPSLTAGGSLTIGAGNAGAGGLTPDDLTHCAVQTSTNLVDWVTLTDALNLVNGSLQISDPHRAQHPQRFYRVINH